MNTKRKGTIMKLRTKILSLVLLIGTLAISNSVALAETLEQQKTINDFSDNLSSHWSAPAIKWGLENNMVSGYPDGTFRTDGTLSEAEFSAIFARYASNVDQEKIKETISGSHWGQTYYNELLKFELPLNGYSNDTYKNAKVSRGTIARVMAAKYGFNLTERQAVYFMYENGLSNGLKAELRTHDSYGANQSLTRGQVMQFLLNADNNADKVMTFKGISSTKGQPIQKRDILGISGVFVDNSIIVDFADFGMTGLPTGAPIDYLLKVGPYAKYNILNEEASYFYDELALKSTKFYTENGKYYISVDLPQLPEGFKWKIASVGYADNKNNVIYVQTDDKYIGLGAGKQIMEIKTYAYGKTMKDLYGATFSVVAYNAQGKSLMRQELSTLVTNKVSVQSTNTPDNYWKEFDTTGIFNWK
jgi:hypothetical protein